ncbi:hypothetical protein NDU88_001121 [Pleurodeles waltl]|uniref:Uncharacterized protein n=1 Tax=Pleurodeles waltl TaxID=8319 RepID=A0AAV7KQ42_PLEWA|nr:hypothetical protein NDU88_001121 [Pleurodeles waltl]
MGGGWGVGGRETSAESQEWVEAGESEEESPQRRVRNGRRLGSLNEWRLESQEWVEAGESEEGSPQRRVRRVRNGWRLGSRRKGDLSGQSGMGKGWGVGRMETSAESQEWVEAGESEELRPQWRVRNGWRMGSRRKGDLSGESGMGNGWGVGGRETSRRVRNGWRLGSRRKGDLSGESGTGGGWGVGGRETSVESQELVEAGEAEEGRPHRRVRNGWRLGRLRNGDLNGELGMGREWGVRGRETSAESHRDGKRLGGGGQMKRDFSGESSGWVEAGKSEERFVGFGRESWQTLLVRGVEQGILGLMGPRDAVVSSEGRAAMVNVWS